jgi:two-component sensor histidine kinase
VLAEAVDCDRFKQFLDHLPIAIAVAELQPEERIVYANPEFRQLFQSLAEDMIDRCWQVLPEPLGTAITRDTDFLGRFTIAQDDGARTVNAWSDLIEDENGVQAFRLVALIGTLSADEAERAGIEKKIREKDTLLRELQHRVKNNLQMITALVRMEARQVSDEDDSKRFHRLAGRVESLALLYRALTNENQSDEVDLGTYLGQIASAVMQAQAVEGIRLELKVDSWPVSINIAMPAGLVVNELMTNALKYAFEGRDGGTIRLQSVVDESGCKVVVADDGIGLPSDIRWPKPGKLGALIVQSLRENAHAQIKVDSEPGHGTMVTMQFSRAAAAVA